MAIVDDESKIYRRPCLGNLSAPYLPCNMSQGAELDASMNANVQRDSGPRMACIQFSFG